MDMIDNSSNTGWIVTNGNIFEPISTTLKFDQIPSMEDFTWKPTVAMKITMSAGLTIGEILYCGAQEVLELYKLSPYKDDIVHDHNNITWYQISQ